MPEKSEKSGAGTKLRACLHVDQNKRMNCINYKELKFIRLFSNLPLFLCEGSFWGYFFVKKIPLSRGVEYVMGGWISGSAMYVCHINQIGSTIKHQSNFLS